jgi:hypothetical protein
LGEDFSQDPRAFTFISDAGTIAESKKNVKIKINLIKIHLTNK